MLRMDSDFFFFFFCSLQFFVRASSGSNSSDGAEKGKMIRRKEKDGWNIDFSGEKPFTPILDTINYPLHMKNLGTHV